MRKKFIKEMALVLSAATVMSSVTACSNSGGGNTETTTQAVTNAIDDGQGNGGQDNTSEDSGKKLAGDYSKEEPIEKIVLQAEDGEFKGNVKVVESTDNGATGKGYVDGFNERGSDEWSYTFTVPQDGHYDFSISSNSGSDNNYNIYQPTLSRRVIFSEDFLNTTSESIIIFSCGNSGFSNLQRSCLTILHPRS